MVIPELLKVLKGSNREVIEKAAFVSNILYLLLSITSSGVLQYNGLTSKMGRSIVT